MPDEALSAEENQPNADTGTPDADPSSEAQNEELASFADFDYEGIPDELREDVDRRVKGFQRSYTQAMQGISQTRQEAEESQRIIDALANPATQQQMLAAMGIQIPQQQEPEPEEWQDPDDRYRALEGRLEEQGQMFQSFLNQQQQAEEVAKANQHLGEAIIAREDEIGREFDDDEYDIIVAYSQLHGGPEGAFAALDNVGKAGAKRFQQQRKATPRRMANGTPASPAYDDNNRDQRREALVQVAEEAMNG